MIQNANNNSDSFYFNPINIFIRSYDRIKTHDNLIIENKSISQLIHIIQLLKNFHNYKNINQYKNVQCIFINKNNDLDIEYNVQKQERI